MLTRIKCSPENVLMLLHLTEITLALPSKTQVNLLKMSLLEYSREPPLKPSSKRLMNTSIQIVAARQQRPPMLSVQTMPLWTPAITHNTQPYNIYRVIPRKPEVSKDYCYDHICKTDYNTTQLVFLVCMTTQFFLYEFTF